MLEWLGKDEKAGNEKRLERLVGQECIWGC